MGTRKQYLLGVCVRVVTYIAIEELVLCDDLAGRQSVTVSSVVGWNGCRRKGPSTITFNKEEVE